MVHLLNLDCYFYKTAAALRKSAKTLQTSSYPKDTSNQTYSLKSNIRALSSIKKNSKGYLRQYSKTLLKFSKNCTDIIIEYTCSLI